MNQSHEVTEYIERLYKTEGVTSVIREVARLLSIAPQAYKDPVEAIAVAYSCGEKKSSDYAQYKENLQTMIQLLYTGRGKTVTKSLTSTKEIIMDFYKNVSTIVEYCLLPDKLAYYMESESEYNRLCIVAGLIAINIKDIEPEYLGVYLYSLGLLFYEQNPRASLQTIDKRTRESLLSASPTDEDLVQTFRTMGELLFGL